MTNKAVAKDNQVLN